ncbi:MAG: PPOX class F420-dependent oxidoreductase [Acidobacteriia bacterium]|nr:PPOX class F420-dependent oxidoreductase [Terriglobia bacterium]MBV8906870.1 PPOX class F420-dependent oxidoreductase [Terriglobia bacterium]
MAVPSEIHGQKYISLATFRKSGVAVHTPIWFAEENGRLYFMTGSKMAKCKRIRNNPKVTIAPCTVRGKITGPEFPATARILGPDQFARVRRLIRAKYWLARVPFIWRNTDTSLEITPA